MKEKNILETLKKRLNLTHKEIAELIGTSKSTIDRWSSNPDKIPLQSIKMMNVLLENHKLKSELEELKNALAIINKHR